MSDDPLTKCPECDKEALQKLLSKSRVGPIYGSGDTCHSVMGDDGQPYRFKSGTKEGQLKELQSKAEDMNQKIREKNPNSTETIKVNND